MRTTAMPLTAFQSSVAHLLAGQRSPESHVAGGAVINRTDNSLRYSDDIDIFHDAAESVASCAEADARVLQEAGCSVAWVRRHEGHYAADVSQGDDSVRLEWSTDSAFRFFPVLPDDDFGYCLHPADIAVNKVLALAGRTEIRDFLDVVSLDENYLGLGALIWAACGKDAGYTPALLLDQTNRHARFTETDLQGENLARPVDFHQLKQRWLAARDRAQVLFERLPSTELGCLYLDSENVPVTPDPGTDAFSRLKRHFGSVRGAWPKIA